ncbi:MAG: proline dehydrogenase, partial [Gemmatimonadetes bacterium]|nr:proline dehydrogenase [Gemmatimonadota bacterium]
MLRHGLLALSESRLARRLAQDVPFSRALSRRFVAGTTVDDVVRAAADLNRNGFSFSVDYLGESVRSREEARAAAGVYQALLARIAGAGLDGNVSLKLSQMGLDVGEEFLRQNVGRVLDRAAELGIFIRFDMESGA